MKVKKESLTMSVKVNFNIKVWSKFDSFITTFRSEGAFVID